MDKGKEMQLAKRKARKFVRGANFKPKASWVGLAGQVAYIIDQPKPRTKHVAIRFLREWAGVPVRAGRARARPGDGFYASWEWKKARFETLKKYGAACMCCGSEERIVVDHIKPRSKFPDLELDLDNLQVLCNDCNMGKSNDDYTDFRPTLCESEIVELEIVRNAEQLQQ